MAALGALALLATALQGARSSSPADWAPPAPAPDEECDGSAALQILEQRMTPDWSGPSKGDIPGTGLKGLTAPSVQACQAACAAESACQAIKYSARGSFDGHNCFLMATTQQVSRQFETFQVWKRGQSGGAPTAAIAAILKAHNDYRAKHGAKPLTWDASLAANARNCAASNSKANALSHDAAGCPGSWGQNLAMGAVGASAVDMWYGEIKNTPGGRGGATTFSGNTGHYTQVVWKSTARVGCATVGSYFACDYLPPGNMMGAFAKNVQPLR